MSTPDSLGEIFSDYLWEEERNAVRSLPKRIAEHRFLRVSYANLREYNELLTSELCRNTESTIDSFNTTLQHHDAHDAAQLVDARILIEGGPAPRNLNFNSVNDPDSWATIPVRIAGLSKKEPVVDRGIFVCEDCGGQTQIQNERPWDTAIQPTECSQCGKRRVEFQLDAANSTFLTRCEAEVWNARHLLTGFPRPDEIQVSLIGPDAVSVEVGDWLRLSGEVDGVIQEGKITTEFYGWSYEEMEPTEFNFDGACALPLYTESRTAVTEDALDAFATHAAQFLEHSPNHHLIDVNSSYAMYNSNLNEEEVKTKLVTPFLETLGWNRFGDEFQMERSVYGGAVDYAYVLEEQPRVIVEAKAATSKAPKDFDQLKSYLLDTRAPFGVLTDGVEYALVCGKTDYGGPEVVASCSYETLSEFVQEWSLLHPSNIKAPSEEVDEQIQKALEWADRRQ